jgi:hypothetical protein
LGASVTAFQSYIGEQEEFWCGWPKRPNQGVGRWLPTTAKSVSDILVMAFNGFEKDAFIKAIAVFNARVPFEKYNFLNFNPKVWMWQKMAYYLRNPNAQ